MKADPKIIFSLNAYPLMNDRWSQGNKLKETLYMTALSVLYAHVWYNEVELFVDKTAYPYLNMLPCKVTLLELPQDKDLWMKSKIQAIAAQDKPFVHLDTDVFLTNKIDFNFKHCILERKEASYDRHYKQQVRFFNEYTKHLAHWHCNLGYAFNCGVLGFANLDLRNHFIDAYYQLEHVYKDNREEFKPLKQLGYEPCIVLEQYNLACLLHTHHISPDLMLPFSAVKSQIKHAKKIGYNHLFGVTKYQKNVVLEIEHQLYKIFPFWYAQVKLAMEQRGIIKKQATAVAI